MTDQPTKPPVRLINMPGTKPLVIRARPEDECPNCQRTMQFHKGRGCYICMHPSCQPEGRVP